jgi:hypothetical protein
MATLGGFEKNTLKNHDKTLLLLALFAKSKVMA